VRIILYLIAFCMILVLINLVSMKKTFLSYVGRNTMTVYVLHLFVIPILEKFELLKDRPYLYLIYSVIMTAVLVFLFTRGVVRRAYDSVMDKLSGFILKDFNILNEKG
jgi:fucose 4-O-acetylase-like acetyltransferase